jgi:hypothetical protein
MLPVRDNTPSHIYAASCFEDNDHTTKDGTAGETMMLKQPLITMNNASLEAEGQTRKLQKERQSRSIIWKSFLLGSSTGFALQVMACAAYYMLSKMFGKDTPPAGPGSLLSSISYCLLVLISQLYVAVFIATWLTFLYISTKSGSLYMQNLFDKDGTKNPNSGTIWTTRMLFMVGTYFLIGIQAGSLSLWMIVNLCIGIAIPLMQLFLHMVIDVVAFLFMPKCFDWSDFIEQELEEDHHSCIV